MKHKKLAAVALLTAIAMCSALPLAACSSSSGTGTSDTTTNDSTTNDSTTNDTQTPDDKTNDDNEFVNPGDDLGGGGTGTVPDEVTSDSDSTITDAAEDISDVKADTTASSEATALEASESAVEISKSGDYTLTGTYSGGVSITKKDLTVHLFLNGANISNSNGIAIETKKGCTVTITVTGENTVENSVAEGAEGEENAIHVKGDLVINGSGTLNVTSSSKAAIKVSKSLKIASATINASAAANCIVAESVDALDATINITSAGKDGIQAECDYDEPDDASECVFTTEKGYISLINTKYAANVLGDGLQADTFVYLKDCDVDISTEGSFVAYSSANMETYDLEADDFRYIKSGSAYQKVASDYNGRSTLYALTQSCKGIKVGEIDYDSDGDGEDDVTITENTAYSIVIDGGTYDITTTDDAVHANSGDITIKDGTLTLNTCDDGITADNSLVIDGGTIAVESSYEGLEGAYVTINSGTIDIVSSDDGINAASDDESVAEYIAIHGGTITVEAEGDGLDSNGSVLIDGGTLTVHGPTNGGDAGLDSETGIIINGGTVFVSSTLGMVETPSTNSTQYVLSLATSRSISANTTLTIKDSDGNELYSVTTEKSCQSVIISLAAFESGKTYSVYSGDTLLNSFTISSVITSVGATTSGMGGQNNQNNPGNMGGMGGRR